MSELERRLDDVERALRVATKGLTELRALVAAQPIAPPADVAFPKPVRPGRSARVAIRKRPKGGTWKADRDECDLLMARVKKVEQPFCSVCNTHDRVRLQWAHLVSRRRLSVRWDWENSTVLCDACHLRYTYDEPAWQEWCAANLGAPKWEALVRRSRLPMRFDPRVLVGLRARAAELGVDTAEGWRAWQQGDQPR